MLVTRGETLEGLDLVAASGGVEDELDLPGVVREGRDVAAIMEMRLELVEVSDGLEEILDPLEVWEDISEEVELMSVSMAMDELDDLRRRD